MTSQSQQTPAGDLVSTLNANIMQSTQRYHELRAQLISNIQGTLDPQAMQGSNDAQRSANQAIDDLIASLENQQRALVIKTKQHQSAYTENPVLATSEQRQKQVQDEIKTKTTKFTSISGLASELKKLVKRQRIFYYFYLLWLVLGIAAFGYMFVMTKSVNGQDGVASPLFQSSPADLRQQASTWASTLNG